MKGNNIPNWNELQEIFDVQPFKWNSKKQKQLERLGYKVERNSGHPKMYIIHNNKTHCITLCSTPSDMYAGRQILRCIRRIYE